MLGFVVLFLHTMLISVRSSRGASCDSLDVTRLEFNKRTYDTGPFHRGIRRTNMEGEGHVLILLP